MEQNAFVDQEIVEVFCHSMNFDQKFSSRCLMWVLSSKSMVPSLWIERQHKQGWRNGSKLTVQNIFMLQQLLQVSYFSLKI